MRKEQLSMEPLSTLLTEGSQFWLKLDPGFFFSLFGGESILPPRGQLSWEASPGADL